MYVGGRRLAPIFISMLFLVSACGGNGTLSSELLPDPNGQYVTSNNDYAYAVAVYTPNGGICSGSRVAENKILTASHCTSNSGGYTVRNAYFYATGSSVVRLGSGNVGDPNDLAIVTLSYVARDDAPEGMQRIIRIGAQAKLGETLRLTGVGCDDVVTRGGIGLMRSGTNLVYEVDDLVRFVSPLRSVRRVAGSTNRVSSCSGDSGGGWSRRTAEGDEVVAVVHAGGDNGQNQDSLAVDLSNADNVAFLKANGIAAN